ncbi:C3HC4 type (RING finger) zinc finger containing protein [Ophiocordyceps camponoti-floridani]|uniref:E3 ubiquitin-protein ligase listerin n=1 Tax=Ophiocordyceps camponoti-floridani TaxID=2030778 RepID=A0A8H4VBK6_9HYPO|nr:C3HC4 type (RING finger) zinc finger containing protein [Ophiocordyceps camponoti-floridani]
MKPKGASRPADGPRSTSGSAFGTGFGSSSSGSALSYLAEPPSFAAVTDPNVVVILKNALKKDSTTKTKALEDLLAHVRAHPFDQGGVDDALLDIWAQLYPRISIDNSRRVRELSHLLQFQLMASARKRMERHVPRIVGSWLAGLYDRDRVVARAVDQGLSSLLVSQDKIIAFWKKCQSQILDFAIEAAQETQDTLSDERTTTAEDAEAKYNRVIVGSLSLVMSLLRLGDGVVDRSRQKLDAYFDEDVVWQSITSKDALVRKTVCQLLLLCLERQLPYADSTRAKQAFVTGGLKTSQSGTAMDFVRALTKLTERDPMIWAAGANTKKSPLVRLQSFIAKGSQGSPAEFWSCLDQLLASLPVDGLTRDAASDLLSALRTGVTGREEPRSNGSVAWRCYSDALQRCLRALSEEDRRQLLADHLFDLQEYFIFGATDKRLAMPLGPNATSLLVEIHLGLTQLSPELAEALAHEWERLASTLTGQLDHSCPEADTRFAKSSTLKESQTESEDYRDDATGTSIKIILHSIDVLERRKLEPVGAAQILEYALSYSPHLFTSDISRRLVDFFTSSAGAIAGLIDSPSAQSLFSSLSILASVPGLQEEFEMVWQTWSRAFLALPKGELRNSALARLVSQEKAAPLASQSRQLQELIHSQVIEAVESGDVGVNESVSALVQAALTSRALEADMTSKTAGRLVEMLGKETPQTESVLDMLEIFAKRRPELFSQTEDVHADLVPHLLRLCECGDDATSSKAAKIRSLLGVAAEGSLPAVDIIQTNLERVGPQSLEIMTLAVQAQDAVNANMRWEDVLPNVETWEAELAPLLERPINPSLAIVSPIGGAVALPRISSAPESRSRLPRDRQGRCVAARMAIYTQSVLGSATNVQLPRQLHLQLLHLQLLSVQLASDQLACLEDDGLWESMDDEAVAQAEELITVSRDMICAMIAQTKGWDKTSDDDASSIVHGLVDLTMKEAAELTTRGVYNCRVSSELLKSLVDAHGAVPGLDEMYLDPELLKVKLETFLPVVGLLTGLGESLRSSKVMNNFCNRLISDIADAAPDDFQTRLTTILLTFCAQIYDSDELPVANNRIVFAVRQISSWTEDGNLDASFNGDICRLLGQLLPCMKDVYGPYWEKTLRFCMALWQRAKEHGLQDAAPFLYESMKLFKVLEELTDANDDLHDALLDAAEGKCHGLLELMRMPRDESSKPLEMMDKILCQEVETIPVARLPSPEELFPLMASVSRDVQTAAFSLLHKKIPHHQEEQSIDLLVEKTDGRLPDELLSLLKDGPTLEDFSDEALSLFPLSVRCYLLSWKLLFDELETPSFKIRNDLTEHLKTTDLLKPFLDFLFDVLGHSAAHPLKLDKEDIRQAELCNYDMQRAASVPPEKNMHWLLAHLYYLVLLHTPGLFRSWYLDCRSKQTKMSVSSWTTKYISPLIISSALEKVQSWADDQPTPPASTEKELAIKVSKTAREVTAGYEVDESHAAIVIRVPADYPIGVVTVSGLRRVAVTERKWQSWIMTTQGVITFSNGSIVDGLQVFRRNMEGALRGQSECAICYSFISSDKRMPDKRCSTCKNLFHRTCLYRWFQTSSQNTCPLCRNPIDYLGADTVKRR